MAGKKEIRAVRTPHGTRVMKTIVCSRCGKNDTISFVPKNANELLLCRDCAEIDMGVTEESAVPRHERRVKCKVCGDPMLQADGAEPICQKCELVQQAARRKSAKKPEGVHPLLVKRSKGP